MALVRRVFLIPLLLAACATEDEMRIINQMNLPVSLDVLAPQEGLLADCEGSFRTRFCQEEYVQIGVIDISAGEDRFLTISDKVGGQRCTNILWLRVPWLGSVGPVSDPGTMFQLPAAAEIETGIGRYHGVAFPQGAVRIDEIGTADANQWTAPPTCGELGRTPVVSLSAP
jgi:hypothetical protein